MKLINSKIFLCTLNIFRENLEERSRLLSPANVDRAQLATYATQAAHFATGYYSKQLPHNNFALNSRGEPGEL